MSDTLKQRILEHQRLNQTDATFAERLLGITERIEREFEGGDRKRLLAMAQDAFERHLELRDHTRRAREGLTALRDDQRRLLELVEFMTANPDGKSLH